MMNRNPLTTRAPDYAGGGNAPLSDYGMDGLMSLFSGMGGAGMGGLAQIFQGMFGDSGGPYRDAMKQMQKYYGDAKESQNPFYNAGIQGMGNYQSWLDKMKDPGAFINKTMEGYNESPWAKNLQQQSMRAGQNMGSASGMGGSTPMMQQMQQNAGNISSGDQQSWLKNALDVNTTYGAGQGQLMQGGQHAADIMSQLAMAMGGQMGAGAYGKRAGENQDFMSMFSGMGDLASLFAGFL